PDASRLLARAARGPAVTNGSAAVVAVPDGPLEVRTRRPGDRVRAAGRDVSLKRFLMDRRVPAQERSALPLLAAGHRVLWVPGQRIEGAEAGERQFVRLELLPGGRHQRWTSRTSSSRRSRSRLASRRSAATQ